MSYWWMSFVDADRPKGEGDRFLGGLIIEADNALRMLTKSHALGLNPGGEVMFFKIPEKYEYRIPMDWVDRKLINRDECNELEAEFGEAPHLI